MKPTKPTPDFPSRPTSAAGGRSATRAASSTSPSRDPWEALAEEWNRRKDLDRPRIRNPTSRCHRAPPSARSPPVSRWRRWPTVTPADQARHLRRLRRRQPEMVAEFGRDTLVSDAARRLHPPVPRWDARLGAHALARNVQAVRTMWNHADENGWVDRRPRFGTIFKKPRTGKRKGKPLSPHDVRKLIAKSDGPDQGDDPAGHQRRLRRPGLLRPARERGGPQGRPDRLPRPKMEDRDAIDRAVILWPETVKALRP
jgi:hypothetical protein